MAALEIGSYFLPLITDQIHSLSTSGPMLVDVFLVYQAIDTKVTIHGSRLWMAGAKIVVHTTVTLPISWMELSSAPRPA